jgi:hypothetical protein
MAHLHAALPASAVRFRTFWFRCRTTILTLPRFLSSSRRSGLAMVHSQLAIPKPESHGSPAWVSGRRVEERELRSMVSSAPHEGEEGKCGQGDRGNRHHRIGVHVGLVVHEHERQLTGVAHQEARCTILRPRSVRAGCPVTPVVAWMRHHAIDRSETCARSPSRHLPGSVSVLESRSAAPAREDCLGRYHDIKRCADARARAELLFLSVGIRSMRSRVA